MTREGFDRLREELNHLKAVERPKNVQDIEEARAHGDLSENAEYHAAKERSAHINGRIQELEYRIGAAEIIDPTQFKGQTRIVFGAHVTVLDLEEEARVTYQIVGEHESDIQGGKISLTSPIARSLIGKSEGEAIKVRTPKGFREFEILIVEYK